MRLFLKSKVQDFFDVNKMDRLSANSIRPTVRINGVEYLKYDEVTEYIYRCGFGGMWRDVEKFTPIQTLQSLRNK